VKLACTNLPELRLELRHALREGFKRSDLLVFRMHDGRAKLFTYVGFCCRYAPEHPNMIEELEDRYEKEIKDRDREMLYVEIQNSDGRYQIGVLDQPHKGIFSILRQREPVH
jgi:hypothetical protein